MFLDAHVTPSFPTNTLMKGIRLKTKALQAKLLTKIRKRHDGEEEEEEEGGGKKYSHYYTEYRIIGTALNGP